MKKKMANHAHRLYYLIFGSSLGL